MTPTKLKYHMPMQVISIDGKPYLFSDTRIERKSIPQRLYAYEIRSDDDSPGDWCQICEHVWVNYWGDIIGKEPLPLTDGSYIPKEDDGFTGETVKSLQEYRDRYDELAGL